MTIFREIQRGLLCGLPVVALVLAGCGNDDVSVAGPYPPPGTMRAETVTALEGPPAETLLRNGSFEEWLAGAPAPNGGYRAPTPGKKHSAISIERAQTADGAQAVREQWSACDWGDNLEELFNMTVTGLTANANYKFEVQANTLGQGSGYIAIATRSSGKNYARTGEIALEPKQGYAPYSYVFNTGAASEALFAVFGPSNPLAYPNTVLFDSWTLNRTDELPTPPGPGADRESGLIPNGGFEAWPVGYPLPYGSFIPAKLHAEVFRDANEVASGQYALHQIWTSRDSIWDDENLFGAKLTLKPRTTYRLTVRANSLEKYMAMLDVHALDEEDRLLPVRLSTIVVNPASGWQEYSGEFSTGDPKNHFIKSIAPRTPDGETNVEIVWDDWLLEEVGPRPEEAVPPPAPGSMIPNGSFELYYTGAPAPEGGFVPPNKSLNHSWIAPSLRTAGEGATAVRQIWTASDREDDGDSLFGITVSGLERNTNYTFSCKRYAFGKYSQQVYVYGVATSGRLMRIDRLDIAEPAALYNWEDYSDTFNSSTYTSILLALVGPESPSALPFTVLWDDFRLTPAE